MVGEDALLEATGGDFNLVLIAVLVSVMTGIVGTVVGYYFGTHQSQTSGGG